MLSALKRPRSQIICRVDNTKQGLINGSENVYGETQDPRSDTAGIGADMINTAFPSDSFLFCSLRFVETAISTAAEWNHSALSSLMKAEILSVGNVFHAHCATQAPPLEGSAVSKTWSVI